MKILTSDEIGDWAYQLAQLDWRNAKGIYLSGRKKIPQIHEKNKTRYQEQEAQTRRGHIMTRGTTTGDMATKRGAGSGMTMTGASMVSVRGGSMTTTRVGTVMMQRGATRSVATTRGGSSTATTRAGTATMQGLGGGTTAIRAAGAATIRGGRQQGGQRQQSSWR
ncbi:hypothetical protein L218DRAFT_396239 [Marasmius fiardii PR-910]|nr:hypothetical protein L218DRAFT_396239 [Marasmius fiardii PR-910]